MRELPPLDPDLALWRWIHRTRDAIYKSRMRELSKYKISAMQSAMMFVIHDLEERATREEISRWIFRAPNSVSEFLYRMEKAGLVKKIRDLDRKNKVRVVLTDYGLKCHHQIERLESIHEIMSCLSKEDRQQLTKALQKLWYQALKYLGVAPRPPFPSA